MYKFITNLTKMVLVRGRVQRLVKMLWDDNNDPNINGDLYYCLDIRNPWREQISLQVEMSSENRSTTKTKIRWTFTRVVLMQFGMRGSRMAIVIYFLSNDIGAYWRLDRSSSVFVEALILFSLLLLLSWRVNDLWEYWTTRERLSRSKLWTWR